MSSYIIQGSSDNKDLAKIECFVKRIQDMDSSVDFQVIIEDKGSWASHIGELCRCYGFKKEHNPIIYKNNGELMGDYNAFKEWVMTNYGLEEAMVQDPEYRNSDINQQLTSQQLALAAKIAEGQASLNERIVMGMQKMLDEGTARRIEGFFTQQVLQNIVYHYKDDQSLHLDYKVPMPVHSAFLIQKEEVDNFDMNKILQKDSNQEDPAQKKMARGMSKAMTGVQVVNALKENVTDKKKEEETKEEEPKEEEQNKEEEQEQVEQRVQTEETLEQMPEGFDSELEKSSVEVKQIQDKQEKAINECFIRSKEVQVKNALVKEFPQGYSLVLNPSPQVYGQCILMPTTGEQYTDQSCQQKKRTNCNKPQEEQEKSFLNRQSVNVFQPLSNADLDMLLEVNKQIDGVAFYQVLPRNAVNVFAQQSQVLHVVPQFLLSESLANRGLTRLRSFQLGDQLELFNYQPSCFPAQLNHGAKTVYYPAQQKLQTLIKRQPNLPDKVPTEPTESQQEKEEKDKNMILEDKQLQEDEPQVKMSDSPVEEKKKRVVKRVLRERTALQYNPNLPHLHLFYQSEVDMTASSTAQIIHKIMMCFLRNYNIDVSRVGVNYVLSPRLVYVSIISKPVVTHGTYQVFPLPMYFYGIINYPSFNALWPDTAQEQASPPNGYQLLQKTRE